MDDALEFRTMSTASRKYNTVWVSPTGLQGWYCIEGVEMSAAAVSRTQELVSPRYTTLQADNRDETPRQSG